jgi:DNA-binding transcriptional MerR regulator
MSAAVSAPSFGGYPITVIQRARELREAGWTLDQISELVERETGTRPACSTVHRWTDPAQERRHRERGRARHRRWSAAGAGAGGRLGSPRSSPEFKLARMRALSESARLSDAAIGRLMRFDFGDALSAVQVAHALRTGRYPDPEDGRGRYPR